MDWTTDRIILDPAGAAAELASLQMLNATLMGDDESKPRYTTKRLHSEIERRRQQDARRIEELLEAGNRYQQEARDARAAQRGGFQHRVDPWLLACFGETIARDKTERSHRFLEEALEAVQAAGTTRSEAYQLVDYVFDRPPGDLNQEVGGVEVTLAAFCLAFGINKALAAETELTRCWTKVEKIRAKQQAKPQFSPLPAHPEAIAEIAAERRRQVDQEGWTPEHDDKHAGGEIALAAATYAYVAAISDERRESVTRPYSIQNNMIARDLWPWSREWWKPTDRIRDLVKAGALIAAEIDRLRRAAAVSEPQP